MSASVFPTPVVSTLNANAMTCASANTLYEGLSNFDSAVYSITCVSSTVATVDFYNGAGNFVASASTTNGSVSVNLGSPADRVRVWTNTGSNIVVTITKTSSALVNNISGTLDTITANTTYTATSTSGYAYAVAVGGGGGGGGGISSSYGGGGGGSGAVAAKLVQLTGSLPVVIGTAGAGGVAAAGGNGGATTFAGMSAGGGNGGARGIAGTQVSGGTGGTATGGTFNITGANGGVSGNNGPGGDGSATTLVYPFVKNGTTGSGGGGASSGYPGGGYGGGSGIGSGGQGSNVSGTGTGYGAGGGGSYQAGNGGAGAPGVVYVLRF